MWRALFIEGRTVDSWQGVAIVVILPLVRGRTDALASLAVPVFNPAYLSDRLLHLNEL